MPVSLTPTMRLSRARPATVVLAVGVAGLATLAAALAWTAPASARLADLPEREGERVAVEARVLRAGRATLHLADATAGGLAFVAPGTTVAAGDEVRVVGVVTRAAEGLALAAERIDVLSSGADRVLAVGEISRAPARYAGGPVAVAGLLARAPGDGWRLLDPLEGARVRLDLSPVPAEWEADAPVVLRGALRYDANDLRYAVAVDAWRPG